jgi:hypothetical protein
MEETETKKVESPVCPNCGRNDVDLEWQTPGGEMICEECFTDTYHVCNDCDETVLRNDTQIVNGEFGSYCVCNACFDSEYSECTVCHRYFFHRDMSIDINGQFMCQMCDSSLTNREVFINVSRPHLDTTVKSFQDTKKGTIITDKRMFSTEIECYHPSNEAYNKVLTETNKNFKGTGQVNDGSLDDRGVGFQTPILRGAKGEKYIKDFSKLLLDNKFYVNTRAGTHIHLDGEGFTVPSLFSEEEILNIQTNFFYKLKSSSKSFLHYIDELRKFWRVGDTSNTTVYENGGYLVDTHTLLTAIYKGTEDQIARNKEIDKQYIQNIKNKSMCMDIARNLIRNFIQNLNGEQYLNFEAYKIDKFSSRLLPAMKQLFTVYYFADDFIMQVLPHSRRNNKYCLPLWKEFNISDIDSLNTLSEFEKMWYRLDDLHIIAEKKRDSKDVTRRHGANFHILMCQGHFELRYHSGTINADKILYWVALNQAFMNLATVSPSKFQHIRQELEDIRFIQNLKLRRTRIYKLLELPQNAIDYWESRAIKFTDENELEPTGERVDNSLDL